MTRFTRQRPVVVVPTMGNLHEGHLSLIRKARTLAGANGLVLVTIFVNKTQFGPREDFKKYPRTLKEDLAHCRQLGVDIVFAPDDEAMYGGDHSTFVSEERLATVSYTHLRAHETRGNLVCRLLLEKKNKYILC